jgi:hypothetical protein
MFDLNIVQNGFINQTGGNVSLLLRIESERETRDANE